MGIVRFRKMLQDAQAGGYAVGSFNALNLEMIRGILAAAEEERAPVILSHAEEHNRFTPLESIAPVMISEASKANVPVALILDHGMTFRACVKALQLGLNAVMFDGSSLSFEENVGETSEIVRIAHAMDADVEAELGHVTRPEGGGTGVESEAHDAADTSLYTKPDQAAAFVARTNVDALAIAFGTAHGMYLKEPVLDFDRLEQINRIIKTPLVMHGGTGLPEVDIRLAIQGGVTKINYYTGMSRAAGNAIRDKYGSRTDNVFYHDIMLDAIEAVKQDVKVAMRLFGSSGKADE